MRFITMAMERMSTSSSHDQDSCYQNYANDANYRSVADPGAVGWLARWAGLNSRSVLASAEPRKRTFLQRRRETRVGGVDSPSPSASHDAEMASSPVFGLAGRDWKGQGFSGVTANTVITCGRRSLCLMCYFQSGTCRRAATLAAHAGPLKFN